jgi:DNA primase
MAEQIPREFIDLLLAKIDLVDLISLHVPLRKKSSSNYFARCPFHQEKSASFSVSQPKQFYYCFGCGAHGNAIDFLMQHERLNFPEAIEALARQAGMEIPHEKGSIKKQDSLIPLFEITEHAANYYYDQMRQSERAIQYLKNRGISGQIARQFMLGYAPPGWSHLLDSFGKNAVDQKKLLDTGLIIKKNEGGYYDRFRDRIMFPIHDQRGRIIGFGGRILDQGEPKYLNSPETPLFQKGHELYGLYQVLKSQRKIERLVLVEGYMDVIALFQHGILYAVATLGTATTAHHLQRLFRYTSEIVFCFDGDAAGRTAAWRALEVAFPLMHDHVQIRFLFLPEGEDPDSLVRKEGKDSFEERIATAHSLSAFFLQNLSKQNDMNTLEGRARFAAAALTYIKQLEPNLLQSMILDELSKRARIDIHELKKQLRTDEPFASDQFKKPASIPQEEMKAKLPAPMRQALALLVQFPKIALSLSEQLIATHLPGAAFLTQLIEIIKQNPGLSTGGLLEYFRGQKEEGAIVKFATLPHVVPENGVEGEFSGMIRQLNMLGMNEKINQLLAKAAQEGLSDAEKLDLTEAIAEKQRLIS